MFQQLLPKAQVYLSAICPLAFVFLLILVSGVSAQTTTTFSNNTGVTINDASPGTPYPSTISVSGLTGTVTKVTATLNNFTHQFQDDAGFLLVGPGGQKVRLMTDAGGNGAGAVTLTFDDAAPTFVTSTATITTGTYKPTQGNSTVTSGNPHPANFPAPAPASPYSLLLSSFNGVNPNGTWNLYVDDDTAQGAGSISGWSLSITRTVTTAAPSMLEGRVSNAAGRGISKASVNIFNTNTQENKLLVTNPFGYFRFAELRTGDFYIITVKDKRYVFSNETQGIQLTGNTEINFVGEPRNNIFKD